MPVMEIKPEDQRDYQEGLGLLRTMVPPDRACQKVTTDFNMKLESGMSAPDFFAECQALLAETLAKHNDVARLGREKPLKSPSFALSRFLYIPMWESIKVKEMPLILNGLALIEKEMEEDLAVDPLKKIFELANVFNGYLIIAFLRYVVALQQGKLRGEGTSEFQGHGATLDQFIHLKQTDIAEGVNISHMREQISSAVGNATSSSVGIFVTVPEVFKRQFGEDITPDSLEQIILNLKELLMLEAMLHPEKFSRLIGQIAATRQERKVIQSPAAYVIGLNTRSQLSMTIRPELVQNAQLDDQTETPQLGCPMMPMIRDFVDTLWSVLRPLFNRIVENPNTLNLYCEKVRELPSHFNR